MTGTLGTGRSGTTLMTVGWVVWCPKIIKEKRNIFKVNENYKVNTRKNFDKLDKKH